MQAPACSQHRATDSSALASYQAYCIAKIGRVGSPLAALLSRARDNATRIGWLELYILGTTAPGSLNPAESPIVAAALMQR